METLSEQEVMGSITQLVRRFTGQSLWQWGELNAISVRPWGMTVFMCPGNPIITPKRILRSQWFRDPWTLGSYSYLAKGCSVQDVEILMEPLPTNRSQAQVPASSDYKVNIPQKFTRVVFPKFCFNLRFWIFDWRLETVFCIVFFVMWLQFCLLFFFKE